MKSLLTIFMLGMAVTLFGQIGEGGCAANAGPDITICVTDPMVLEAPVSASYDVPPLTNIGWQVLPTPPMPVTFSPGPNNYNVTVNNGGGNWAPGQYNFRFCALCKDTNGDGVQDRVCDDMTAFVSPPVTQAQIIEPDGTQDGHFTVCHEADITVNLPGNLEQSALSILPDDGLVTWTKTSPTTYHLVRSGYAATTQGECTYDLSYTIKNEGCNSTAMVKVTFVQPQDPNLDGIIEGRIFPGCPSCTNTLTLRGDRPGCGGAGTWSVTDLPPNATATFDPAQEITALGYAVVTLSEPGNYTFEYTVTNEACPASTYQIACSVLQTGDFFIGHSIAIAECDNLIPAGTSYHFEFNQLKNAIYEWEPYPASALSVATPHDYQSDVTVLQDIDLSVTSAVIKVRATRYFLDPDCEGPLPNQEIELPYTDPEQNWSYIQELLAQPGICWQKCTSEADIWFFGSPDVKMKSENVNFLCSDGTEFVRIGDYFEVVNYVPHHSEISVLSQPPGSSLPATVSENEFLKLEVDGCGQFVFEIVVKSVSLNSSPVTCPVTKILTINVAEARPVTAGTDQIHCCVDPDIRLNGNNPYGCGTQGTWRLLSCSSGCSVTFENPHDPNTRIYIHDDCSNLPVTLDFEWSFSSEEVSCRLADTTRVILNDTCCTSCLCPVYHVEQVCVENQVVLSLLDQNNNLIDPATYNINWGGAASGHANPTTVAAPPGQTVHYTVEVFRFQDEQWLCYDSLAGDARCDTSGCGVKVVERCDDCGNVLLTLVDAVTGIPVVPTPYVHEVNWRVFGSGPNDNSPVPHNGQNPIIIPPGACYSLSYTRYYYSGPPIPGTWTDICEFKIGPVCPPACEGPCEGFSDFFIAGCGDARDAALNLVFPDGCQNVCNAVSGTSVTLGVFRKSTGLPVGPPYQIVWKNGATGTYVTGQLNSINSVRITNPAQFCCFWEDGYSPVCCDRKPFSVQCEQPITKFCRPDGSVSYVPGIPQISWVGVAGAVGYELDIDFDGGSGCCAPNLPSPPNITVSASPWQIPAGWDCFTVRIRAIYPNQLCVETPWSDPYAYCRQVVACNPVIVVCGCCHERSDEGASLPVTIVPEEVLSAYLKANPGPAYGSLQEALAATGFGHLPAPAFSVFPNPANNVVTVHPTGAARGIFTVEVTDLLQRRWQTLEFDGAGDAFLNVGDYPQGLYLVSIRDARGNLIQAEKITVLR